MDTVAFLVAVLKTTYRATGEFFFCSEFKPHSGPSIDLLPVSHACGPAANRHTETSCVVYGLPIPSFVRQIPRVYKNFGIRKKIAVFFCRLARLEMVRLKGRLYDVIDVDRDEVLSIPLCNRCAGSIEMLSRPIEPPEARDVVIVT